MYGCLKLQVRRLYFMLASQFDPVHELNKNSATGTKLREHGVEVRRWAQLAYGTEHAYSGLSSSGLESGVTTDTYPAP